MLNAVQVPRAGIVGLRACENDDRTEHMTQMKLNATLDYHGLCASGETVLVRSTPTILRIASQARGGYTEEIIVTISKGFGSSALGTAFLVRTPERNSTICTMAFQSLPRGSTTVTSRNSGYSHPVAADGRPSSRQTLATACVWI